jgi:DDE superfamily endonuclease
MNRIIFDTYIETQLAPTLEPGDAVILDNLPAHKSTVAEATIRERGAWMLFLPAYSPDLKWPSRNSKPIYAQKQFERSTTFGKPSVIFARYLAHSNAETSSKPPDMGTLEKPML